MEDTTTAELEVPGEPGVYWCARHKKVKTRLRCGRCETPICPQCTVMGPTGARCRNCASNRSAHMYQVRPEQYAAAIIVSVLLGSVSGMIASLIGFFALFYAPVAGTMMGKAVSHVTKHKRGTTLAAIAVAGLVLGAMIPPLGVLQSLLFAARTPGDASFPALTWMLTSNITNPFIWVYLALSIPSVWWWLK